MTVRLLVFGLGYSGRAIAREAASRGADVTIVTRDPAGAAAASLARDGFGIAGFDAPPIGEATHLVATAAPSDEGGDPVLAVHRAAIVGAKALRWVGYLSTTGVYGDRGGAWVDETTAPAPGQSRSIRRLAAERAWAEAAGEAGGALDVIRLGGIYGPGRSPFDDLRAGTARRIAKPGHSFSRIHVADIAGLVTAAIARPPAVPVRVLNGVDDTPAPASDVVEEAARLLGIAAPPAIDFDAAQAAMSPMALSFWSENRKVSNALSKAATGWALRCPSYREGLRAILAER
ncbi:SDR family NAD(P)-dependent oxidoreductase [Elioraea sp.]|uniref:SDR family NAD(P)-dependent oxidoreductase n=1 Tax=Elioraea sp. TaxID=2185103 RepID=UPI0025BD2707|nr:SDR family NAD(P)-dependent oxidoreductase [Elioraea sp.]